MSKELTFMIYCIEEYRARKEITGKEVIVLFNSFNIFQYLKDYYECLHTMGIEYIIQDIDFYIHSNK